MKENNTYIIPHLTYESLHWHKFPHWILPLQSTFTKNVKRISKQNRTEKSTMIEENNRCIFFFDTHMFRNKKEENTWRWGE
jgi:hypothetical protein